MKRIKEQDLPECKYLSSKIINEDFEFHQREHGSNQIQIYLETKG